MDTFTLKELNRRWRELPTYHGIYCIRVPDKMELSFFDKISGHPDSDAYPADELLKKYKLTGESGILYIGKAGGKRGLQQRLHQYMKYGFGGGNNHRGGRAIFQIKDFEKLLCAFKVVENCEEKERELLRAFQRDHGTLPVANWRI